MTIEIKVPTLGKTVKKAKIAKWLVKPGQTIKKGEVLCELETEKVTFKVEAEYDGLFLQITCKAGKVVKVDQVIGLLGKPGVDENLIVDADEDEAVSDADLQSKSEKTSPKDSEINGKRLKASPLARKIAKENNVPLTELEGSGPQGRIVKADVLVYDATASKTQKANGINEPLEGLGVEIPLTQMRRVIGDRLTTSSRDVPHVYFSAQVDCSKLVEFRSIFKPIIEKSNGGALSYNDLILKAVSIMILKYPMFNGTLTEDSISIKSSIDIGLAMAVPAGLIVPVIRNTERMSVGDICLARKKLITQAQDGELTVDDMTNGTFTISSLGQFDIDFFTSIINPPETAILSVARMKDRPVAIDGELFVRPTMMIGLSIDHRVVDGSDGAQFLNDLKRILENPYELCQI